MSVITMRHMKSHERGRIIKVQSGGMTNRRLRDMGLVPGTEIEIQGRAPLNDPVNIKIRGNCLTLRNNEADAIQVEVER